MDIGLSTLSFATGFVAVLAIYALARLTGRSMMMAYLIIVGLTLSFLCNGWLMLLLPCTALLSWLLTRIMAETEGWQRKSLLWLTIALDLLPLCYFKYATATLTLFSEMFGTNFSLPSIALPVGISFYTFQAISYTADIYQRRFLLSVSLLEYLFFLTFFPLMLAGPITRAGTFFPQARRKPASDERLLYMGLWLVMSGIVKKVILADYLAQYNNWIFSTPEAYSGLECVMGVVGFAMQIYLDFSGYSDLSIGMAAMMGIRLRDNFEFPYRSRSLTEFWHRWHISLSTWFRDYVYIPLGGNRGGRIRTTVNLLLTMLLAGLWHGSTLMFLFWGMLHGLGLVVQKLWCRLCPTLPDVIATVLTLSYVALCWIFFRAPDVSTAISILHGCTCRFDLVYLMPFVSSRLTWCLLLAASMLLLFVSEKQYRKLEVCFVLSPWIVKLALCLAVAETAIRLHTSDIQPFLYFNF